MTLTQRKILLSVPIIDNFPKWKLAFNGPKRWNSRITWKVFNIIDTVWSRKYPYRKLIVILAYFYHKIFLLICMKSCKYNTFLSFTNKDSNLSCFDVIPVIFFIIKGLYDWRLRQMANFKSHLQVRPTLLQATAYSFDS